MPFLDEQQRCRCALASHPLQIGNPLRLVFKREAIDSFLVRNHHSRLRHRCLDARSALIRGSVEEPLLLRGVDGIEDSALERIVSRAERSVYLNDMEFKLTEAAIETLAVLAEARMDGDVMTGAALEAMIQGRDEYDCEEAAGATRVKRLRDSLGNQMVAEMLVRTIARRGYVLSVDPAAIRMI